MSDNKKPPKHTAGSTKSPDIPTTQSNQQQLKKKANKWKKKKGGWGGGKKSCLRETGDLQSTGIHL